MIVSSKSVVIMLIKLFCSVHPLFWTVYDAMILLGTVYTFDFLNSICCFVLLKFFFFQFRFEKKYVRGPFVKMMKSVKVGAKLFQSFLKIFYEE